MNVSNQNARFLQQLNKYIEQQEETIREVVSKTIVGIVDTLVDRTPVGKPEKWTTDVGQARVAEGGYEPGRYKSSWNVALDKIPMIGYNNSIDSTGQPSVRNALYEMDVYTLKVNNICIVNTAENPDTGEYYPVLIQSKETKAFPGYSYPLHVKFEQITYDYAAGMQDDVIGSFSNPSSSEFRAILARAVKNTR